MAGNHAGENGPARALALGLALTVVFAALEAIAGLVTGSLALLSDAGHSLTDSAGLLLALAATGLARRPADARRTYGYARYEVMAVPVNVTLLLAIAGYIVYESIDRLSGHDAIDTGPAITVGAIGLAVNLVVVRLLHHHSKENLNARAAWLDAAADALGSLLVVVSLAAVALGAWEGLDTLAGLAIALFVVPRAISLLRQAGDILLESAPPGLSPSDLLDAAREVEGVLDLHDVHVWSIAPHFPALSAHVELASVDCTEHVLTDLTRVFRDQFGIGHVTLQPETPTLHEAVECCLAPDSGRLDVASHAHRAPAH